MSRKQLVVLSALLVTAWGTFALSYASSPPTEGLLGLSVIIGVTFTCFAALLIMRAWTEGESELRASVASALATLVILLLAWLPNLTIH
jgi:hypothetical protein